MVLIASERDWEERCEAEENSVETVEKLNEFETRYTRNNSLESGCSSKLELRDLWLEIDRYRVNRDVTFESEADSWGPVSSFFVAGTAKNQHVGLTGENIESPGNNYLEAIHCGVELDTFLATEPIVRVRLGLKTNALKLFGETSTLPKELALLAAGETPISFYRQSITSPEMQVILHQIINCPYQGAIKQIYLEGKALELTALQFNQLNEINSPAASILKGDDIERLHHAAAILIERCDRPPSIVELARQVGLNDFKLKQGFRQVFNTTVFGYLREYRLERSRLLLTQGELSVRQVAKAMGYKHPGHFAAAFQRKFGAKPKEVRSKE